MENPATTGQRKYAEQATWPDQGNQVDAAPTQPASSARLADGGERCSLPATYADIQNSANGSNATSTPTDQSAGSQIA